MINATDLSPILESTQVKEIREVISTDVTDTKQSRPVEISIKVAELPTTTPIEVGLMTAFHDLLSFSASDFSADQLALKYITYPIVGRLRRPFSEDHSRVGSHQLRIVVR